MTIGSRVSSCRWRPWGVTKDRVRELAERPFPSAKGAGPGDCAGLTDIWVSGIEIRWIGTSLMAIGADPVGTRPALPPATRHQAASFSGYAAESGRLADGVCGVLFQK